VVTEAVSPREGPGQLPLDALSANTDSVDDPDGMIAALKEVDGVIAVVDGRLINDALPPGENYYAMTANDARALGLENVPESEWVSYEHYELMASDVESVPTVIPVDAGDVGERG
jgi:hypothetical protein